MLHEDLRFIHEDVERLELAIADRQLENPKKNRNRLARDHEIAYFSNRIQEQSKRALQIYNDRQDACIEEIQRVSTGDSFGEFYKQYASIREFHKRNTNEKVENLEIAYNRPQKGGPANGFGPEMNSIFTGEEAFGMFFDLTLLHEEYLNLPGVRSVRRPTYVQYLDIFNHFKPPHCTIKKSDKLTDQYFSYVGSLAQYLESFMRKTRPLEELERIFAEFDRDFEKDWEAGTIPGWETETSQNGTTENGLATQGTGEGVWCADCAKEFKNDSLYKSHLTGRKHIRNAEARAQNPDGAVAEVKPSADTGRLKEKAIAEREYRIRKLASAMQTVRAATRDNVERKAGLTERERQEELEALYGEDEDDGVDTREEAQPGDDDGDEKIYNPLKLPLAWDGKPIPFWLYKLHGLGTEYPCEICGNFVYQGRRNFEKHFSEPRHVHGLRCLGITSTSLFREITRIEEAEMLWNKVKGVKKDKTFREDDIVEMEDSSGVVMPLKIYNDLQSEGLL